MFIRTPPALYIWLKRPKGASAGQSDRLFSAREQKAWLLLATSMPVQRTADDSVRYAWEATLFIGLKPDGSFEASDVPAGHYTLEVGDSSGSDQERKTYFRKPIDVLAVEADDQALDVGDLQMAMPPAGKQGPK